MKIAKLCPYAITLLLFTSALWAAPPDREPEPVPEPPNAQPADAQPSDALRRLEAVHWQQAISARDVERDWVKAGHHFLAAGRVSRERNDPQGVLDAMRAARGVISVADQAIVQGGSVYSVSVSPDQRLLATCSIEDNVAFVWSLETGELIAKLPHSGGVARFVFHPKQAVAATASYEGVVTWNLKTNTRIATLNTNRPNVRAIPSEIVFVGTSRRLLVRSNRQVTLWDPIEDDVLYSLTLFSRGMSLDVKRNELFIWCGDGKARVLSLDEGAVLDEFSHPAAVHHMKRLHDNRILTFAIDDSREPYTSTGRVWSPNARMPDFTLEGGQGIECLEVHPAGQIALSSGAGRLLTNEVYLWSLADGTKLGTLTHEEKIAGAQFARTLPSPASYESVELVISHSDTAIKVWNLDDQRLLHVAPHPQGIRHVSVDPNGAWLAVVEEGNSACIYAMPDSTSRKPTLELRQVLKHGKNVRGLQFLAKRDHALTWGDDGVVRVWNLQAGQPVARVADPTPKSVGNPPAKFWAGRDRIWARDRKHHMQLWNTRSARKIHDWSQEAGVSKVWAQPDRDWLLTTHVPNFGEDSVVKLWDPGREKALRVWKHESPVKGAFLLDTPTRFATWTAKSFRVWNADQDDPEFNVPLAGNIRRVAPVPNSRLFVAIGAEGPIYLIDAQTGEPSQLKIRLPSAVDLRVSADGSRIVAWDANWQFVVLPVEAPDQAKTLKIAGEGAIEVSPDGKHVLATNSQRRQGRLFSLDTGLIVKQFHRVGVVDRELFRFKFASSDQICSWGTRPNTNRVRLSIWDIKALDKPKLEYDLPSLPRDIVRTGDGVLLAAFNSGLQTLSLHEPRLLRSNRQARFGLSQMLVSPPTDEVYTANPRGEVWRWDISAEDASQLEDMIADFELASGMTIDDNGTYRVRSSGVR